MKWFEKVAEKYNMIIDKEIGDIVLKGLEFNKFGYGARYCPCKIQRISDNICPCKEMRENKICHCGLFVNQ